MTHAIPVVSDETDVAVETSLSTSKSAPLRHNVREFLRQYFMQLENLSPNNVYELVLAEMEVPLLEIVLQYVGQNQSKAARLLEMSRGTLRKKMQRYGLLPSKQNHTKMPRKRNNKIS